MVSVSRRWGNVSNCESVTASEEKVMCKKVLYKGGGQGEN